MTVISYILLVLIVFNTLVMLRQTHYVPKEIKVKRMKELAVTAVYDAERLWGEDMDTVKHAHAKTYTYLKASTVPYLRRYASKQGFLTECVDEAFREVNQHFLDNPEIAHRIRAFSVNPHNPAGLRRRSSDFK